MTLAVRLSAMAIGAFAVATTTHPASACATCGCGDPTLTAMGTEKPYRDRLRASLDVRHRTDAIGQPEVDRLVVRETRFDSQLAWAPHERLFLLATVPVVHRRVSYVNDAVNTSTGLGDVELRAKAFVYVDRSFAPRHLFALTAGLKVPTAPRQRSDLDGAFLPIEAQPGTGSWDPLLGMSYAFFARPVSLYASVQGTAPLRGTSEFRGSPSMRTTTAVQYQVFSWLAPRLGIDTRLDARSYEGGLPERDSSGFIAFVSPEMLVSPLPDVVFVLSLRVPVVQALAGYHDEGPMIGVAAVYDF